MSYGIIFKPAVEKDLKPLPKSTILRVFKQILALQENPLPSQAVKLSGMDRLYRLRVGDYRIVYEVATEPQQVVIHYIRHRRDVYRKL